MKYHLKNLARRPVSIICSNGKAMHLPPKYSCEVDNNLVGNNEMIKKLIDKHLISLKPVESEEKISKAVKKKAVSSKKKPLVKKKTSSKKAVSSKK